MKSSLRRLHRAVTCALAALPLLCLGSVAGAQVGEAPPAGPLTIDQCVEIALKNNPGLAIARARLTGSEGARLSSYSSLLPSVSMQTGFNRDATWSRVFIDNQGQIDTTIVYTNSWSLTTSIVQPLIAPSRWYMTKAAGSDVRAAQQSVRVSRAELVYQVRQAYLLLVRSILLERVTSEALQITDAQASRSQAMFEVGSVARSDVLQAEVNRASAERDEINARNGIERQRALLSALMGIDVARPLEVQTEIDEAPAAGSDEPTLIREALEIRPEIGLAREQIRSARYRDRSAFWNLWPTLDGSLSYQKISATFGEISDLGELKNHDATWGLSIGLRWNVFDGLASIGGIKTSRAEVAVAREAARQEELNAAVGIREALVAIKNAREGITASEHGVSLAEENHRLQQALYENGGGTILDLNTAQAALTKARIDEVDAKISLHIAVAQLDRAIGTER